MSVLMYNGIVLPYAFATSFSQDAIRDESDTDWYCTRFNIEVQCIINSDYLSMIAPDLYTANLGETPATDNPAVIMKAIRTRLLKHRKTLSFKFNGVELIPQATRVGGGVGAQTIPGTVDAQNGPKPQTCQIIQMTNKTFLCVYRIVAHYWENNFNSVTNNPITRNLAGNPILYNRWEETVDINNLNLTTRVRSGKFIIRSDNVEGFTADDFRKFMVPTGIPPNFLRKSGRYTVSPDGLGISYQVVDEEVWKKPPSPAFTATGHYYETTTRFGAIRYGEAYVRLQGDRDTPQHDLATIAVKVAAAKVRVRGIQLELGGIIVQGGFTVLEFGGLKMGLYENEVECTLRCMVTARKEKIGNAIAAFQNMNSFTPRTDAKPDYLPDYRTRGKTPYVLQAAAYWDPSILGARLNRDNQLSPGVEVGAAGVNREP